MSAKKNRAALTGLSSPQELSLSPSHSKVIEPELTPEQVAAFWNAVRSELNARGLGAAEIGDSIKQYRVSLITLDAENAVYHDEPAHVADVLEAGIKQRHRSDT